MDASTPKLFHTFFVEADGELDVVSEGELAARVLEYAGFSWPTKVEVRQISHEPGLQLPGAPLDVDMAILKTTGRASDDVVIDL
eukprot:8661948-Pyramimonas_sp.AAC.1